MRYRAWRGPYADPWLTLYIGYTQDGRQITLPINGLSLLAENGSRLITEDNFGFITNGPVSFRLLTENGLQLLTENNLNLRFDDL